MLIPWRVPILYTNCSSSLFFKWSFIMPFQACGRFELCHCNEKCESLQMNAEEKPDKMFLLLEGGRVDTQMQTINFVGGSMLLFDGVTSIVVTHKYYGWTCNHWTMDPQFLGGLSSSLCLLVAHVDGANQTCLRVEGVFCVCGWHSCWGEYIVITVRIYYK